MYCKFKLTINPGGGGGGAETHLPGHLMPAVQTLARCLRADFSPDFSFVDGEVKRFTAVSFQLRL